MNSNALNQLKEEYQQSMKTWATTHITSILRELKQARINLTPSNIEQIIEETNFKTRSKKHPTVCPIYKPDSQPCHENIEELNCFLCACPEFIYKMPCYCKSHSPDGKLYENPNIPGGEVWDCNGCIIPHAQEYLRYYLEKNIDKLKELSDLIPIQH